MTDIVEQWTGTGFRLPLVPDPVTGRFASLKGMDLIRQSVTTILDTEPGERIMLPGFGCGLRRYLMAPNSVATRTAMAEDIKAALEVWEPRIQLLETSVTAGDDPSLVWIDIAYVRRADRRADNLVYPFYLQ
ncbi:GPW/gp25 family protein [Demequina mangrovi]|uniref:IraD/Gp25-like domain-containing protein n=1 Tax=Demequina mangrovi TaxID=1043493 RepID=A0A1H6TR86_9MICO|nr:GPW/gp25 family protein [Demequina mangrovi]SEI82558.1 hypothetical protein SAMN05421637_0114 [Demequina mangrovi]